jgi:hypothetical protein
MTGFDRLLNNGHNLWLAAIFFGFTIFFGFKSFGLIAFGSSEDIAKRLRQRIDELISWLMTNQ